ncbi:hypothetical protein BDV96DRAFT_549556 [Lophiotrema nucula]|uniref:Altered inheritance of mitochondria protein 6 n=1 Tax=Lophiotrema nucula TaxID=690887 RepID=A0A6A5Z3C5_9PLEO|nr:hypothetical protein BDV96DRAFT_549556 [Lophiotrema nucula]
MTLRRRDGREPMPKHQPLRLPSDDKTWPHTRTAEWTRWVTWASTAVPVLVLCFFGVVHLANIFMGLLPWVWDDKEDIPSILPNWGAPGQLGEGLSSYPMDLTRDVIPIQCHSHNDYWRRVPLYEALHYGCTGVEADVWLYDNDLFVGHNTIALTKNRTFRSLYLDPLLQILDTANAVGDIVSPASNFKNGVFDANPKQTLVLLVDFKTNGPDLFPVVQEQLSSLREKGYLTYADGKTVLEGPITVVATGNAPFDLINANTTYRDIFFDAPLDRMYEDPHHHSRLKGQVPRHTTQTQGQGTVGTDEDSRFDLTNSYYASVSFASSIGRIWGGRLSHKQKDLIRGQIKGAHRRGLKVRYWATPQWPVGLRNHVWNILIREGVDYLNGDDLRGMTKADWSKKHHHGWL